jgi:hypothetical protein
MGAQTTRWKSEVRVLRRFDHAGCSTIAVAAIALLASQGTDAVQNDTARAGTQRAPSDLAVAARNGT